VSDRVPGDAVVTREVFHPRQVFAGGPLACVDAPLKVALDVLVWRWRHVNLPIFVEAVRLDRALHDQAFRVAQHE
jgi:hypothetical protein